MEYFCLLENTKIFTAKFKFEIARPLPIFISAPVFGVNIPSSFW